jgi:BioD-like phosphotransacetylase family protein
MDVLCVASDDPILNAVPISDMVEALGGKVLCAQDKLDQLAENISIGAMTADVALRFFQRTPHKVVITGGDRADIQLTALQTSTRCLILTGDLYPNERILTRAEELGVPVILVSQDTFTTAETCDRLRWHMSLNSEHKIARAVEIVDRCMDWKRLQENLGMD